MLKKEAAGRTKTSFYQSQDELRTKSEISKTRYNQSFLDPVPSHRVDDNDLINNHHFRQRKQTLNPSVDP